MPQKLSVPEEDVYHIYPVLKIPTGRRTELLILGLEKAEAVIEFYPYIVAFVRKHRGVRAAS